MQFVAISLLGISLVLGLPGPFEDIMTYKHIALNTTYPLPLSALVQYIYGTSNFSDGYHSGVWLATQLKRGDVDLNIEPWSSEKSGPATVVSRRDYSYIIPLEKNLVGPTSTRVIAHDYVASISNDEIVIYHTSLQPQIGTQFYNRMETIYSRVDNQTSRLQTTFDVKFRSWTPLRPFITKGSHNGNIHFMKLLDQSIKDCIIRGPGFAEIRSHNITADRSYSRAAYNYDEEEATDSVLADIPWAEFFVFSCVIIAFIWSMCAYIRKTGKHTDDENPKVDIAQEDPCPPYAS